TSLDYSFLQVSDQWLWWGAFIPAYLSNWRQAYRILTSMFLHANIAHIFFNMLFLYNFGRQVEATLGGKRYLLLYFGSGLAAEVFHTAFIPIEGPLSAVTPAIGASGAISGVLGAYLLLFPGSRLSMCFFYLLFPICITTNAAAYLIFWFAMQVLQGYAGASAGVAVFAHAGGFLGGIAMLPYVIDRHRHRLLRSLTASRRALKYLFLGHAGLSLLSKFILIILIAATAAGGVYSAFSSHVLEVPIKVLLFKVEYRTCELGGVSCVDGYDEDIVILKVDGEPQPATQITTSSVRILYNRLNAIGALYDRFYAGTSKAIEWSGARRIMGVNVAIDVKMNVIYDENGIIEQSKGTLQTDVLTCTASTCTMGGTGTYTFDINSLYSRRRLEALSSIVTLLSIVSLLACIVSIDNVVRKSHELEIVA
ncbi:MAG: rhomboid family intramembrane serine protease, partial [Thermofilaceae archaeon]